MIENIPRGIHGAKLLYRIRGLCQECGGKLDQPGKFVRCKACRDQRSEYARAYNRLIQQLEKDSVQAPSADQPYARRVIQQQEEQQRADERRKAQIRKCAECEWSRIGETTVFCPFMEGICMKGDYHAN